MFSFIVSYVQSPLPLFWPSSPMASGPSRRHQTKPPYRHPRPKTSRVRGKDMDQGLLANRRSGQAPRRIFLNRWKAEGSRPVRLQTPSRGPTRSHRPRPRTPAQQDSPPNHITLFPSGRLLARHTHATEEDRSATLPAPTARPRSSIDPLALTLPLFLHAAAAVLPILLLLRALPHRFFAGGIDGTVRGPRRRRRWYSASFLCRFAN